MRDSLAALAEICATRRGRLALRSGNVAADILAAAGALRLLRLLHLLRSDVHAAPAAPSAPAVPCCAMLPFVVGLSLGGL